jgi:hypothetical protein
MKTNMHLKLANLRRFLDKHTPNEHADAPELKGDLKTRLYNIIKRDCLPLAIRKNSDGTYDIVLLEHQLEIYTQENTKSFYVLEVDFRFCHDASVWVYNNFNYTANIFITL